MSEKGSKKKENFRLYFSDKVLFDRLTNEEAGILINALFNYAMTGENTETGNGAIDMAFTSIKFHMDRDCEKYAETCRKNSNNGKIKHLKDAGFTADECERILAEPGAYERIRNSANTADNDNVNDNDNEKDNDNKSVYIEHAPTKEQVIAFFKSIGMTEGEADLFFNYNQARGWKAGKNPIVDWQALALTWQERKRDFSGSLKPGNRFNNFENQQQYDFGQLEKILAQ